MKRLIIGFSLISFSTLGFTQEIIRPGLIKTQLTISPSYLFSEQESHFYLHGNIEGFIDKHISISGEGYYHLGNTSNTRSLIIQNHGLFFGASYHFTKQNHDFYLGLQPGVSFTKINSKNGEDLGVNPLFSNVIGYNFYVNRYMHFFAQSRLILGQHLYNSYVNLAEFRFSAGLGFNLNTK